MKQEPLVPADTIRFLHVPPGESFCGYKTSRSPSVTDWILSRFGQACG